MHSLFPISFVRLRNSRMAAHVAPFFVFMFLLEGIRLFRVENSLLPWWRQFPEHWGYPLQTIVGLVMLWWWRRLYPPIWGRGSWLAVGAGSIGIVLWLLPPVVHEMNGIGSHIEWLRALGFQDRRDGFNPATVADEGSSSLVFYLVMGMRFLRLVVVVPLVEEIFWRGFLMRFLSDRTVEWDRLDLTRCDLRALFLTALAFGLAHWGPDFFPALIYGTLAGWVTQRTGNLWAVVLMHAVSNLCLGLFIVSTDWWGLW